MSDEPEPRRRRPRETWKDWQGEDLPEPARLFTTDELMPLLGEWVDGPPVTRDDLRYWALS